MSDLQTCLDQFNKLKSRIDILTEQLEDKDMILDDLLTEMGHLVKAKWLLTEVQRQTQETFKSKVEELVTMAIKSVYEDREFGFELIFEDKRNQMEVRPVVYEVIDGRKDVFEDIENEMGGGIVDIISFALRIVLWSLEKPRSRNIIILDEPMKNMGDLVIMGGNMLKEVAHKLGFQLIIVTHDPVLIDIADRSFHVVRKSNKSIVKMMQRR